MIRLCVVCLFALSDVVFHVRLFDCCFMLRTGFIWSSVQGSNLQGFWVLKNTKNNYNIEFSERLHIDVQYI